MQVQRMAPQDLRGLSFPIPPGASVFLPWKDDNPTRRTAWVTLGLIAVNVVVFAAEVVAGDPEGLFLRYGLVPARLLDGAGAERLLPLFTSMFLHGGLLHLASNLLFLWIFGNNVEDALGPVRFVAFYALAGLGAHAAHLAANAGSAVPTVGASGAIAGILGAYLLRYPHARVHTVLYLIFFFGNFRIPAAVVIGAWFVGQLLGGLSSFGPQEGGGIAWFEHLGGFLSGMLLFPLLIGREARARWRTARY